MIKEGLKEVRSKISILLETTGEILFSLEGFKKLLFTIKNFTQGDLHFTWRDSDIFPGGKQFHWRDSEIFLGGL